MGHFLERDKNGQDALAATHAPTIGQQVQPTSALGKGSSLHGGTRRAMPSVQELWLALAKALWPSVGCSSGLSLPPARPAAWLLFFMGAGGWGSFSSATMTANALWQQHKLHDGRSVRRQVTAPYHTRLHASAPWPPVGRSRGLSLPPTRPGAWLLFMGVGGWGSLSGATKAANVRWPKEMIQQQGNACGQQRLSGSAARLPVASIGQSSGQRS